MLVIDSHLDMSMNAIIYDRDLTMSVEKIRQKEKNDPYSKPKMLGSNSSGNNTVSLPELRKGEIFLSLFTILATVKNQKRGLFSSSDIAYSVAHAELTYYNLLESKNLLRMIKTKEDLHSHFNDWRKHSDSTPLGFVLAMEGADPILEPNQLKYWWDKGLRVLSLCHYDENQYGYGTGVKGKLKPSGYKLLEEMEKLGMVMDVTHFSEQCFWDALDAFNGDILASHNNCRSLVPGVRQFSDDQINAIIERGGVIGVALDNWMLHEGWVTGKTPLELVTLQNVVDHIDHICEISGDTEHAAIGTDLDGGYGKEQSPSDLDTIVDLQKIVSILEERGYSQPNIEKIMYKNWLRKLEQTMPS
jgi:membrane dipeptidase